MSTRLYVAIALMVARLLGVAGPASAQVATIEGHAVDDRTGQPVTQILVTLENASAAIESQGAGGFTISVEPGRVTLTVSAIGYAVSRVDVDALPDQITPVTIRLSEGAGSYSEHVDVVGGSERSETSAGAVALFGRDLQSLRGAILDDPLRAVQALPNVSATDDFYSEFSVRGSSFRHINLTVDGIASKYLMHTVNDIVDGGSVTMVNSETLGAVELLPGSYPQKVGRRLGAEVNLLTRNGTRERFRGRAGLSGTSATFLGEGPLARGHGSWLASVRRSYLDYLITRIDPSAGFAFGFTDGQAKLALDVTARNQLEFITLLGRAAFDGGGDYDGVNDTARAASHAWLSSLGWRHIHNSGLAVFNRAYVTGLEFDNRNPFDASLDTARFSNIGWRADGSVLARSRALVQFGGDAQWMDGRHTRRAALPGGTALVTAGDYTASANAGSAYAQAQVPVSVVTVTPGIRWDYYGMTQASAWSPWLNISASLGARTTITSGTGIYRQFAEFDQVFGLNGGGTRLQPERAVHVDVSVEQRLLASTTVQVTAFFRRESDVLWPPGAETRLVGNRLVQGAFNAKWTNALNGDGHGAELVVRREAPGGLSGWVGYAYGRLRYDRPAGAESFWANADQRHTMSAYGNYRLTARTSVSAKYRYGSNFPVVGYLTTAPAAPVDPDTEGPAYYQVTSERNTVRLRPYSRLDLRADHAFPWSAKRLVLFVEVANVPNRKNLRNTPYSVDRSGRAFGVTESMMPIIPSAGFVVEF